MLCKNCGQQTDESKSGLCQSCGIPLASGEYSPPDGYAYHAESDLYYQSNSGYDINTGEFVRQIIWFDSNSGEYHTVNYPEDTPKGDTASTVSSQDAVTTDYPDKEVLTSAGQPSTEATEVELPPPPVPAFDPQAPLHMPRGFVRDAQTGQYYCAMIKNGHWSIIWYDEEKNDYRKEQFRFYDTTAETSPPKKRKGIIPSLISILTVLVTGVCGWYFSPSVYIPSSGAVSSTTASSTTASSTTSSVSSSEPATSEPTSSEPAASAPESKPISSADTSSITESSNTVSNVTNEIPTDKTGFVIDKEWFARSMCVDRILPNGKWENSHGTKAAYINHHTTDINFTLWLVLLDGTKTVDYQCEMKQDESDPRRYVFKNDEAHIIVDNFNECQITINATINNVSYGTENFIVVWNKDALDAKTDITENSSTPIQLGSYICRNVLGSYMDLEYSPRITLRPDYSFSFIINTGEAMRERKGKFSVNGKELTLLFDDVTAGYIGADNTTATLLVDGYTLTLDGFQFGLSESGTVFTYLP